MKNQCTAKCKATQQRCRKSALPGGRVCCKHGGSAPQVKAKALERLADLIDPDRALREAAALAYADISDMYDDNYKLKPMKEWPPSLRKAVKRMEPRLANLDPGDGASDKVLRVEMHDKIKPLEMLFKHMGLLEESLRVKADVTYRWEGE